MDLFTLAFVVGRVVFGGYFVMAGVNHFSQWKSLSGLAAAHGLPAPRVAVLGSGALLVLGGISVVLGLYPVVGLLGLVLFLLSAAVLFHSFWKAPAGDERMNQMTHFLKNLALAGAAVMMMGIAQPW